MGARGGLVIEACLREKNESEFAYGMSMDSQLMFEGQGGGQRGAEGVGRENSSFIFVKEDEWVRMKSVVGWLRARTSGGQDNFYSSLNKGNGPFRKPAAD